MSSFTPQTAQLDGLPNELLTIICEDLYRSDLKQLRLVARNVKSFVEHALFRTLHLHFTPDSFKNLESLAHHPLFSTYVRALRYEPTYVYEAPHRKDIGREEWLWRRVGVGFPSHSGQDTERSIQFDRWRTWATKRFTEGELDTLYDNYRGYMRWQEFMREGQNEENMLSAAFQRFPALAELQFSQPERRSKCPVQEFKYRDLSSIAQKILVEPDEPRGNIQIGHFWNMFQAIHTSGRIHLLTTMRCSALQPADFDAFSFNLPGLLTSITNLETLSLWFDDRPIYLGTEPTLIDLSRFVSPKQTWNHLSELSLRAITTTEADLSSLLLRHSTSLRSLKLNFVRINPSISIAFVPGQGRESLIRFFMFLHSKLSLTSVRFQNRFYYGNTLEAWEAIRPDVKNGEFHEVHEDNMLFRIENYIIGKGPFPFEPTVSAPEQDQGNCVPASWTWEEDASWHSYVKHPLPPYSHRAIARYVR